MTTVTYNNAVTDPDPLVCFVTFVGQHGEIIQDIYYWCNAILGGRPYRFEMVKLEKSQKSPYLNSHQYIMVFHSPGEKELFMTAWAHEVDDFFSISETIKR